MATSKILLGPIPHARYDWVSGASYGKEAIVFHKGSSYIALSDNPSTEPSFTYDPATGSYNVSAGWRLLAVGAEIVQETGDSQNKVMSQKAVTDALTASDQKLSELERKYNPSLLDVVYSGVLAKNNSGVVNYKNVMEGLSQDDVIFIQANKLNGSTVYLSLLNGTSTIAEDILIIKDSSETFFRIPSSCDGIRLFSTGASSISLGISKCLQPTINSLESDNDILPLSAAQGKKLKQLINEPAYSNTSLQCSANSVTKLLPLVVNNGDYLICKITGNTGVKSISLWSETEVVDEDIVIYGKGNRNGNIIIKVENNTTHFKVYSDTNESINIAFYVVKDKIIKKSNNKDVFGKEYGSFIMTTFYNDIQRLRVLVSSNGKHFTEIVTNKDINNGEQLRDPDLVKVGEYYYIAITGAQLKIYKTKDFVNYSLHTTINPAIENRTYYWAPEIFKDIDGKKYLIFAGYYMPQDAEKYIVTQYIAEMSDDMTTLIGTPSILELPGVSKDYQFDTTVCYIDGKYYAACFGKSLVIYRSNSLINGYEKYKQISLEKALLGNNYFEGPSIIHDSKYIYIYVTQNYPGFVPNVDTKAIGVYVFDMEWNYIGFSWCENVVDYPNYGTPEDNKVIGEHPKVLPVTNEIIAKIISSIVQ